MSLKIKIKWAGSCKRHTKYNPEKMGLGGIRGGCPNCQALLVVYEASINIKKMIKVAEGSVPAEQQGALALHS